MRAKLGPDHPDTLTNMSSLAVGYRDVGKLDLALPLLEETLKLRRAKLGPDHPDTLRSMGALAGGYMAARKLDLALPLLEKTLKLMRAKLGPDHPYTLTNMNNLAAGYRIAGKLDRALPLMEETLKLEKAKLGHDHPHTLLSMNNLAGVYWSARQLSKSVPLFEEALKLQEKKLGRQHPQTLVTVANLGVNYNDSGRVQEAIPLLEEAFQAARLNPTLRWVGPKLLDVYAKAEKTDEAAKLVTELLAEVRKQLPKNSTQLAGDLAKFGMLLLQAHAFTDAEALLRECLTIREKTQPDAWTTFNTMSRLGWALLGQKKYAAAEPLLLKGYEGMKQREKTIPAAGSTRIAEALDRLIEFSTATNKSEEAEKWRAERAKYPEAKRPVAPEKKRALEVGRREPGQGRHPDRVYRGRAAGRERKAAFPPVQPCSGTSRLTAAADGTGCGGGVRRADHWGVGQLPVPEDHPVILDGMNPDGFAATRNQWASGPSHDRADRRTRRECQARPPPHVGRGWDRRANNPQLPQHDVRIDLQDVLRFLH
jgi:tetratricopeptide (TPR) repeat protein